MYDKICSKEIEVLKNHLCGKDTSKVGELLELSQDEISILNSYSNILTNENWKVNMDLIVVAYQQLVDRDDMKILEKTIQKINAKKGFPIKRQKLKYFSNNNSKSSEAKGGTTKRNYELCKNDSNKILSINTPIKIFRHYDEKMICKTLKIDTRFLKELCNRLNVDYQKNKMFSQKEWIILSPELEEVRKNVILGRKEKRDKKRKDVNDLKRSMIEKSNEERMQLLNTKNMEVKKKFDLQSRKDEVQKNALSGKSFMEISTGMRD
jgi:hypothetical protein